VKQYTSIAVAFLVLAGCGGPPHPPGYSNIVVTLDPASKKPTVGFGTQTPTIYVFFDLGDIKDGQKIKSVWYCEKSRQAPPNYKIDEVTLPLKAGQDSGSFSCSKPDKGWPSGRYRVELYLDDQLKDTEKFLVQ